MQNAARPNTASAPAPLLLLTRPRHDQPINKPSAAPLVTNFSFKLSLKYRKQCTLSPGRSDALHLVLPNFRSPAQIHANNKFLIDLPKKPAVLHMLAYGLRGDWGPDLPPPNRSAANYLGAARINCRHRFQKEVRAGRMIGGPGWTHSSMC